MQKNELIKTEVSKKSEIKTKKLKKRTNKIKNPSSAKDVKKRVVKKKTTKLKVFLIKKQQNKIKKVLLANKLWFQHGLSKLSLNTKKEKKKIKVLKKQKSRLLTYINIDSYLRRVLLKTKNLIKEVKKFKLKCKLRKKKIKKSKKKHFFFKNILINFNSKKCFNGCQVRKIKRRKRARYQILK